MNGIYNIAEQGNKYLTTNLFSYLWHHNDAFSTAISCNKYPLK